MTNAELADEIERNGLREDFSIADTQQVIVALRRSSDKVLVPREPTEAMLTAAAWELGYFYAREGGWCGRKAGEEQARLTYRAMLAAVEAEGKP